MKAKLANLFVGLILAASLTTVISPSGAALPFSICETNPEAIISSLCVELVGPTTTMVQVPQVEPDEAPLITTPRICIVGNVCLPPIAVPNPGITSIPQPVDVYTLGNTHATVNPDPLLDLVPPPPTVDANQLVAEIVETLCGPAFYPQVAVPELPGEPTPASDPVQTALETVESVVNWVVPFILSGEYAGLICAWLQASPQVSLGDLDGDAVPDGYVFETTGGALYLPFGG